MNIAITGGTGFIGQQLLRRHLALGDNIRILTRNADAQVHSPCLEYVHGDLAAENSDFEAFVDRADILYHCAGEIRDPARMQALHVEGTRRLIAAASGRIGRWVQLSSVGVYGPRNSGHITEETSHKPVGEYEVTKAESDSMVEQAARSGAFDASILRPSIVYGPQMTNKSLFQMIAAIDKGLFFFIGKPGASANYIYVENVVEALFLCGTVSTANVEIYNLSDWCSMESFVGSITQALGKPVTRRRLPEGFVCSLARLAERVPRSPLTLARVNALTNRSVYVTGHIERELGYRHLVSMEDGVRATVEGWLSSKAVTPGPK